MKIKKGRSVRWRFNQECFFKITASILTIPLVTIMLDVFRPKTCYDYYWRGGIISNIREALALRSCLSKVFIKKGEIRYPYAFGSIYPENPNVLTMDDGTMEELILPKGCHTIEYIKQMGKILLDFTPFYIVY